ncbi:unnamed protein product, partial [Symbiodinium necroappetens]
LGLSAAVLAPDVMWAGRKESAFPGFIFERGDFSAHSLQILGTINSKRKLEHTPGSTGRQRSWRWDSLSDMPGPRSASARKASLGQQREGGRRRRPPFKQIGGGPTQEAGGNGKEPPGFSTLARVTLDTLGRVLFEYRQPVDVFPSFERGRGKAPFRSPVSSRRRMLMDSMCRVGYDVEVALLDDASAMAVLMWQQRSLTPPAVPAACGWIWTCLPIVGLCILHGEGFGLRMGPPSSASVGTPKFLRGYQKACQFPVTAAPFWRLVLPVVMLFGFIRPHKLVFLGQFAVRTGRLVRVRYTLLQPGYGRKPVRNPKCVVPCLQATHLTVASQKVCAKVNSRGTTLGSAPLCVGLCIKPST